MLAEIEASYDSMDKQLGEDKSRQQDLLKRRLEARRRKKAKLSDDLNVVDQKVEEKEAEFAEKKDVMLEKHNKEYQEKC